MPKKVSEDFQPERKTNPWAANQHQLDPRQKLCWEYYSDPKSETFNQLINSALKAGYEESYADTVSQSPWFCARMWRLNAVFKSEQKTQQILDLPIEEDGKLNVGIIRVQADLVKFLQSTLGKGDGYSTRTELTGVDGKDLAKVSLPEEVKEELRKVFEESMKRHLT